MYACGSVAGSIGKQCLNVCGGRSSGSIVALTGVSSVNRGGVNGRVRMSRRSTAVCHRGTTAKSGGDGLRPVLSDSFQNARKRQPDAGTRFGMKGAPATGGPGPNICRENTAFRRRRGCFSLLQCTTMQQPYSACDFCRTAARPGHEFSDTTMRPASGHPLRKPPPGTVRHIEKQRGDHRIAQQFAGCHVEHAGPER